MDLRGVGWVGRDWIDLAQHRNWWRVLVNEVMNLRDPYNAGKLLSGRGPVSFSRRLVFHGVSSKLPRVIYDILVSKFRVNPGPYQSGANSSFS